MLNTKQPLKKKGVDGELLFCIAMVIIPVIQFIIFYVIVNFNSFLLAFQKLTENYGEQTWTFVGFENFKTLWTDLTETTNLMSALKNSLKTWLLTTVVGVSGSVIASYYIFKKGWLASTFRLILFLPTVLPAMLLAAIFQIFVDTIIPEILNSDPLFVLGVGTAFPMALFYTVWFSFGSQVLIYNGTMSQIEPSIMEAAKLDGASPLVELWYIVLPEIIPAIGTFLIAGIATIFTNQAAVFSFHGPDAINYEGEYTLGYWLYTMTLKSEFNYPYASAVGLVGTMIALPFTFIVKKLVSKVGD